VSRLIISATPLQPIATDEQHLGCQQDKKIRSNEYFAGILGNHSQAALFHSTDRRP
jgi:hypothetical protein